MGEYVYRAQQEYIDGEDIKCQDSNSEDTISAHVHNGSKNIRTRFISTTGRVGVAKYKYSRGNCKEKCKRAPIILIDLKKLREKKGVKIHDFRDPELLTKELDNLARNYALADREITIEGNIPADCCRKIPPLIVDIISLLDLNTCSTEVEKKIDRGSNADIRTCFRIWRYIN